ncbi:PaaI family thioesterase [Streptomyces piniterrae]|uniref:PaaI family thioesterase n=1 Tax=Streptomyces piniterrae TaxID=2571125 RepID=UPI003CCC79AB
MSVEGEHVEDQAQQEQASPEVQKRIQASFDRQGLMSHLDARITHIAPGRVRIELPSRPEVTQQHGYFHAGATSAIADSAGGYAAYTLFPEDSDVLTVEYKINLLAPAVGDHIEAVGTVLKSGRTLTVCQLEVFGVRDDGERKLVANGQQTLIRVDRPGG